MKCLYCGQEIEANSTFCGYCGKKQAEESTSNNSSDNMPSDRNGNIMGEKSFKTGKLRKRIIFSKRFIYSVLIAEVLFLSSIGILYYNIAMGKHSDAYIKSAVTAMFVDALLNESKRGCEVIDSIDRKYLSSDYLTLLEKYADLEDSQHHMINRWTFATYYNDGMSYTPTPYIFDFKASWGHYFRWGLLYEILFDTKKASSCIFLTDKHTGVKYYYSVKLVYENDELKVNEIIKFKEDSYRQNSNDDECYWERREIEDAINAL